MMGIEALALAFFAALLCLLY